MTQTEQPEKPKFNIWLGDNWPGPYIVTYDLRHGHQLVIVVNGVRSPAEAAYVAQAEYPQEEHEIRSMTVTIGHVAEASHHPEAIRKYHADHEEIVARHEQNKP